MLQKMAGKYCVGDEVSLFTLPLILNCVSPQVTMADVCLVPQVNNAKR